MAYTLELSRAAQRSLEQIARGAPADYRRIQSAIDGLMEEPRPRGAKKLGGRVSGWRLRVGEYRVIYAVFDSDHFIFVNDVLRRTSTTY